MASLLIGQVDNVSRHRNVELDYSINNCLIAAKIVPEGVLIAITLKIV